MSILVYLGFPKNMFWEQIDNFLFEVENDYKIIIDKWKYPRYTEIEE